MSIVEDGGNSLIITLYDSVVVSTLPTRTVPKKVVYLPSPACLLVCLQYVLIIGTRQ